jgi:hypothetical protein
MGLRQGRTSWQMWNTAAGLEEARKWGRERIRLKRRKRMG